MRLYSKAEPFETHPRRAVPIARTRSPQPDRRQAEAAPPSSALAGGAIGRSTTLPPAFSTAAIAAFEAPATSMVSGAQLALWQEPHAVAAGAAPRRRPAPRRRAAASALSLPGVERLSAAAEIDDLEILLEHPVVEAALRQPAMQRRLAAFEAVERDAGARGLAFAAAPVVLPLPEPMPRPTRLAR